MDAYRDSILEEFRNYDRFDYLLLYHAEFEYPEDNVIRLILDDTLIAREHKDEIVRILEKIFNERCNLAVSVQVDYKEPDKSIIEEFEKAITPRTRAIMICNPNNPTGYLYTHEELLKVAGLVKKYDLYLFADEVYREFCYDGHKHFSVMQLEGLERNTILFDSVSKRYSACGARVGCLVTRNSEVYAIAMRLAQARLSPPSFGQIFAEAAVDTPQEYFDAVQAEYVARRNVIVEGVNKIPGCFCPMPKGAFYTVIDLPIDDSDRFCQWLLTDFSYNGATVMLAPATGFYVNPEQGRHQARITYCLCIEDLKAAMKCLEEALKVYPGRTR